MSVQFDGFDWDEGNRLKCQKHGVSIVEIESLFESLDLFIAPDIAHSDKEKRFRAVGPTTNGRFVFLVFTIRRRETTILIRPISARFMHKKEIEEYEEDIT